LRGFLYLCILFKSCLIFRFLLSIFNCYI